MNKNIDDFFDNYLNQYDYREIEDEYKKFSSYDTFPFEEEVAMLSVIICKKFIREYHSWLFEDDSLHN